MVGEEDGEGGWWWWNFGGDIKKRGSGGKDDCGLRGFGPLKTRRGGEAGLESTNVGRWGRWPWKNAALSTRKTTRQSCQQRSPFPSSSSTVLACVTGRTGSQAAFQVAFTVTEDGLVAYPEVRDGAAPPRIATRGRDHRRRRGCSGSTTMGQKPVSRSCSMAWLCRCIPPQACDSEEREKT